MQENTSICCSQTASNLSETALGAEVEMVIIYLGVITDQSVSFKMLTENLMFKMKFAFFFLRSKSHFIPQATFFFNLYWIRVICSLGNT